jgi:CubicO group peptidase (beta-lactamase class C family)
MRQLNSNQQILYARFLLHRQFYLAIKAYYGYPLDQLLHQVHVKHQPNKKWRYQCVNYILAGLIIEKATGMSLGDFTQKYLWTPMGAEHTAYWGKDKSSGYPRSFCCLYATARDFAKLGLILLHNGHWNNQQIIPENYIKQMLNPASQLKYKWLRKVDFYKLGLWIYPRKKIKVYYFAGVYGQYIFVLPDKNAVIVRLGQMVNQLDVMRIPPDVPLYLKIGTEILNQYENQNPQLKK